MKREVEEDKGEVKRCSKFQERCNEAGTSVTLNNCTFIVSKDFKLSHVGTIFHAKSSFS